MECTAAHLRHRLRHARLHACWRRLIDAHVPMLYAASLPEWLSFYLQGPGGAPNGQGCVGRGMVGGGTAAGVGWQPQRRRGAAACAAMHMPVLTAWRRYLSSTCHCWRMRDAYIFTLHGPICCGVVHPLMSHPGQPLHSLASPCISSHLSTSRNPQGLRAALWH